MNFCWGSNAARIAGVMKNVDGEDAEKEELEELAIVGVMLVVVWVLDSKKGMVMTGVSGGDVAGATGV